MRLFHLSSGVVWVILHPSLPLPGPWHGLSWPRQSPGGFTAPFCSLAAASWHCQPCWVSWGCRRRRGQGGRRSWGVKWEPEVWVSGGAGNGAAMARARSRERGSGCCVWRVLLGHGSAWAGVCQGCDVLNHPSWVALLNWGAQSSSHCTHLVMGVHSSKVGQKGCWLFQKWCLSFWLVCLTNTLNPALLGKGSSEANGAAACSLSPQEVLLMALP